MVNLDKFFIVKVQGESGGKMLIYADGLFDALKVFLLMTPEDFKPDGPIVPFVQHCAEEGLVPLDELKFQKVDVHRPISKRFCNLMI